MYGAGDVWVDDVPDATLREPTDAVVGVLRSCVCGSDLWPYGKMPATDEAGWDMSSSASSGTWAPRCPACTAVTWCRRCARCRRVCTGHHAAVTAGVSPRTTVTVGGDGAVGLSAVLAATGSARNASS